MWVFNGKIYMLVSLHLFLQKVFSGDHATTNLFRWTPLLPLPLSRQQAGPPLQDTGDHTTETDLGGYAFLNISYSDTDGQRVVELTSPAINVADITDGPICLHAW